MCTGTAELGAARRQLFGADFETMEGAAFALFGMAESIPVVEIRAISNYAATREMLPSNIVLALKNLKSRLPAFIGQSL